MYPELNSIVIFGYRDVLNGAAQPYKQEGK